jgi:hypothetical protein
VAELIAQLHSFSHSRAPTKALSPEIAVCWSHVDSEGICNLQHTNGRWGGGELNPITALGRLFRSLNENGCVPEGRFSAVYESLVRHESLHTAEIRVRSSEQRALSDAVAFFEFQRRQNAEHTKVAPSVTELNTKHRFVGFPISEEQV